MIGNEHLDQEPENRIAQPSTLEARLLAVEDGLTQLTAVNQRLVEEIATLRQEFSTHVEAVTKLERGVRYDRWWRRFWLVVRLLIFLTILGAVAYLLLDWQSVWLLFV